jgi:low affinity Fe/Cu permease
VGLTAAVTREAVEAAVEAAVASRLDGLVVAVRKTHTEVIKQGHATRQALVAQVEAQAAEIRRLREQVAQLQASLAVTSAY